MRKLISLMLIPLLSLILVGCSSSKNAGQPLDYEEFQSINVGSFVDNNGSTVAHAKKLFGKPSSVTTTNVNGKESKAYVWEKLAHKFKARNVTVTFENNRAIAKGFDNVDINHLKPVAKEKVKAIKIGASYDSVINKLGQPDSETESGNAGTMAVVYLTGTNGRAISYLFNKDKVTQITISELK